MIDTKEICMANNPDVYLLYEYMKKNAFTVRVKVTFTETVEEEFLVQAAREAMTRFPYFSVSIGLDEGENYVLLPNDRPIAVLPEKDERLMLGSEEVGGHLFAITWKGNDIWFNWAHCICGGFGSLFWIKTTLYQYLTKKYGYIEPPADLKAVGSQVDSEEYAYPDTDKLPLDEPMKRYEEGNSYVGLERDLIYFINPFADDVYYYQIEFDSKDFMEYVKEINGTPNSVLVAFMLKTTARYYPKLPNQHISAKILADYRKDIGCPKSYRDYVRFIHVKYDWDMEMDSIERLSQHAREAINTQKQPENSYEWYRRLDEARRGIDEQPDLKSKKKYAQKHSIYKSDVRDTYVVSYVGKTDWGGMTEYIDSIYVITDGNMMLELMALPDKLCLTFQLLSKDRKLLDLFCEALEEEKISFSVSDRMVRYMPDIMLPEPENR